MLHIHNGDSTAGTLKEFGFPGVHKAFQEVLMEGPAPAVSPDEFRETRVNFLANEYSIDFEKCEKDWREQEAWLSRFSEHEEAILWFEHDLFCQINLTYLLDWFSSQTMGNTRLSLVCVGEFAGVDDFRGLGQPTGEQLASLSDNRHEVSPQELGLANQAWAAYRSSSPLAIGRLVESDTSAMPFLERALRLHLMRFPSTGNGLGRVENKALELISTGAIVFKSLFPRFAKDEQAYGLGDSQFWSAIKRLGGAKDPLITIGGITDEELDDRYYDSVLELTETGRTILEGERDFIDANGVDLWLGGVHLEDADIWRWDQKSERLTQA